MLCKEGAANPITKEFFPSDFINLNFQLTHDGVKKKVTYSITTTEDGVIATAVKLVYKNTSWNSDEKSVSLGGYTQHETAPVDLNATNKTITGTLDLDFDKAKQASFQFEVVCAGITLHDITKQKTFKAPPEKIDLSLHSDYYKGLSQLNETNNSFRVEIKSNYEQVDLDQVFLQITRTHGTNGYLSDTTTGNELNQISGKKICGIPFDTYDEPRENFYLYVNNPKKDDELGFKLQLYYEGKSMSDPLIVEWQSQAKNEAEHHTTRLKRMQKTMSDFIAISEPSDHFKSSVFYFFKAEEYYRINITNKTSEHTELLQKMYNTLFDKASQHTSKSGGKFLDKDKFDKYCGQIDESKTDFIQKQALKALLEKILV